MALETEAGNLLVTAEEDADHYHGRTPGITHPHTESQI